MADHTRLALNRKLEIDRVEKELATEKQKFLDEKAIWDQKMKDAVSQRDSVKRQYDASKCETSEARELVVQEWKGSEADKDFAADMGLLGAEVATEVTLDKL